MAKLIEDLGMLYTSSTKKYKHRYGIYECPYCKTHFKAQSTHINQGNQKSCGCLKKTNNSARKHNKANKTRLYTIWKNMRQRCFNGNSNSYKNYGGRGITICDEWTDFQIFENWALQNGYKDNLSIDRINNDGNYEPSNCRWTTRTVQARNTRAIMVTNKSGYRGVYYSKKDRLFISKITINKNKIVLGYFKTAMDGAKAYDKYVQENNLSHTKNGVINDTI